VNITICPSGEIEALPSGTLLVVSCFAFAPVASITHTSPRSENSNSGLGARVNAIFVPSALRS